MRTVLLLHGHGEEPASLAPIAERLTAALGAEVATPTGTVPVAGGGFAWWPDDADGPDEAAVDELRARHRDVDVVVGHSQGAALALRLGLGRRVAVVAGFLAGGPPAVADGTAVLVVHGEGDETVDPLHGRMVVRRCRAAGATVQEHWHDGGHAWTPDVTELVVTWLAAAGAHLPDVG